MSLAWAFVLANLTADNTNQFQSQLTALISTPHYTITTKSTTYLVITCFVFLFSSLFVSSGLILILYMLLSYRLHEVFTFDSSFALEAQPNPSILLCCRDCTDQQLTGNQSQIPGRLEITMMQFDSSPIQVI